MAGWESTMLSGAAYLVAESGSGGTSIGLHLARCCLEDGGRVLWAAPEMPDPSRFSQVLGSLSLAASTRFHAMNLIGRMDLVTKALEGAARDLPGVRLVVLDDWAPSTGRIPAVDVTAVVALVSALQEHATVLLIAKPGTDMEAEDGIRVRSQSELEAAGCTVWRLEKINQGRVRLSNGDMDVQLTPTDDGFEGA